MVTSLVMEYRKTRQNDDSCTDGELNKTSHPQKEFISRLRFHITPFADPFRRGMISIFSPGTLSPLSSSSKESSEGRAKKWLAMLLQRRPTGEFRIELESQMD